jgi:2-oxoglutarate dehydrogenase complex dehydrogenase (E1) component-like enzyme
MMRNYRKGLVLAAPKQGLRNPLAASKLSDFAPENTFNSIYENSYSKRPIKDIFFCSGKIFFDLHQKIGEGNPDAKIIRIEELSPFPMKQISEILKNNKNAKVRYIF